MAEHSKKNKSFISNFVPTKGDSTFEVVRKCIFLLSIVVVIVCIVLIIIDFSLNSADEQANQEIRQIKYYAEVEGDVALDPEVVEKVKAEEPEILDEYIQLYEQNSDIVGWIKIDDTPIDYAVMQSDDNKYYLDHNFNKEESKLGAIFADWRVPITATSMANNVTLYGHNIASGEYFAKLTNYYPRKYGSLDFYLTHPTITFDTIYEKGTYKIFAAMYVNTQEKHGSVFEYYRRRNFTSKISFMDFMANVMDRSVFYTDVDVEYGDQILTLSTCYYPLGDSVDTRFVLVARKLREGESAEVDVSKAYTNPSPLYFDYYYNTQGGSWQGRTWDTSKVKDFDEYAQYVKTIGVDIAEDCVGLYKDNQPVITSMTLSEETPVEAD